MIYYYMIRFDMIYVYLFIEALIQIQIHFNCFIFNAFLFILFYFKDGTSRDEEDNSNNDKEVKNSLGVDSEED